MNSMCAIFIGIRIKRICFYYLSKIISCFLAVGSIYIVCPGDLGSFLKISWRKQSDVKNKNSFCPNHLGIVASDYFSIFWNSKFDNCPTCALVRFLPTNHLKIRFFNFFSTTFAIHLILLSSNQLFQLLSLLLNLHLLHLLCCFQQLLHQFGSLGFWFEELPHLAANQKSEEN